MEEKKTYKIGQILVAEEDMEVEKMNGEKVCIPKGNKSIVAADGYVHHLKTRMLQRIPEEIQLSGYDEEGIAEYLMHCLAKVFPLHEMLEDYEISEERFKDEISFALDEIGL